MDFSSINFVGVLVAFLVNFLVGAIWFGPKTFFPMWWKAMGKEGTDPGDGTNMVQIFASTAVASFVAAIGMELIFDLINRTGLEVEPGLGFMTGLTVGLFTVAAPALSHRLFSGNGFKVWLIESGGDITAFAAMGFALSWFY